MLRVLMLTEDRRFGRGITAACVERGFAVSRLGSLGSLPRSLGTDPSPSVLLIDADRALPAALRTAATVAAIHPGLPIVLAADRPQARSESGFRLVDRRSGAATVVDEIELGHVGIPAYVFDRLRQPSA
jgi:hypothetical protein